jgi:prophage antirepressor-like protein
MSTALTAFNFKGRQVRVVMLDGEPWFEALDVCALLDIRVRDAMSALDEDEKLRESVAGLLVDLMSESGVYSTILRSRKPEAREFKRWVTREVLPSIRKTGGYLVPAAGNALDVLKQQALVNLATVERLIEIESTQRELESRLGDAEDRLASVEGRRDWITAVAYSLQHRLPAEHCTHAFLNRLGGVAGRIGRSWSLEPEKARDEKYGYVNMWPTDVWDAAYGELKRRGVDS